MAGGKHRGLRLLESDLQTFVLDLAKRFGLRVAHFPKSKAVSGAWVTAVAADGKGFPDLVIVGLGGVLWRELKDENNSPTAEQKAWLAALQAAGQDAAVWRPRDKDSGRIQAELDVIRRARVLR